MPSRQTAALIAVGTVAAIVALLPTVRAESAAADAPCSVGAYVFRPTTGPETAYSTVAPTPSIQGAGAERTLTVTGAGYVERAPDTAYLDVRISASGADAVSASCANERAYTALRTKLAPRRVDDVVSFPGQSTYLGRVTPAPAGASLPPGLAPGWVASRFLRIVTTPGAPLRDAVAAVEAVHGTATTVQYALTDRGAAYELALASAMRDAASQASAAAHSGQLRLGPLVRVEVAGTESSSTAPPAPLAAALATTTVSPVLVRASLTATFALAAAANASQPAAALVVVHPYGMASRPPEYANLSVDFSDRDNDRTALLYRHETAYDALWTKLRALGIDPSQVPNSVPQAIPNRTPVALPPAAVPGFQQPPLPSTSPMPFYAYALFRQVRVNAVPIAKVSAVIGAFAAGGANVAEVTFSVGDRTAMVAEANADVRRNGAAQAKAVASAAGLRLVEPPYVQIIGYPLAEVTIWRTSIGSADHPRIFEPPSRIEGFLHANIVYAVAR
jgi:uncharacterized protein YggE